MGNVIRMTELNCNLIEHKLELHNTVNLRKNVMKPGTSLLIALIFFAGLHRAGSQVSFAPASNYAVGTQPQCVIAADVNGDGKLDLICANFSGTSYASTLTVLTNDGNGGFGSNTVLTVGPNPVTVVAVDVNGDGKVDLVSANLFGTLTVLTNNGNG